MGLVDAMTRYYDHTLHHHSHTAFLAGNETFFDKKHTSI